MAARTHPDDLRALVAALERGEVTGLGTAARPLAEGLHRYLAEARNGLSLDEALGLKPLPGQPAWFTVEKRQRRDAALREIAEKHFAHISLSNAAEQIARLGRRVLASSRGQMTVAPEDDLRRLLHDAIEAGAQWPGPRQIFNVLRMKKARPMNFTSRPRS